jgi:YXWGXW repeat-containing protein
MKNPVKFGILLLFLLAGLSAPAARAQVSIGISIGAPPPPRVIAVVPTSPGPDFVWVEGYWYPVGNHYKWHEGYWTRPPYIGAHWVPPHHDGQRYFVGYWDGDHGRIEHDHHWDKKHDRDYYDHDRDDHHDHDNGHDNH